MEYSAHAGHCNAEMLCQKCFINKDLLNIYAVDTNAVLQYTELEL